MWFHYVKMDSELQGEGRDPADSGVLVTGPDVGQCPRWISGGLHFSLEERLSLRLSTHHTGAEPLTCGSG